MIAIPARADSEFISPSVNLRRYSSTLRYDLKFSNQDAFETFPFPTSSDNKEIERKAEKLFSLRNDLIKSKGERLTSIYNKYHDPSDSSEEMLTLRCLHQELDASVLSAYGWSEMELTYRFNPDITKEDGKVSSWRYSWP